MLGVQISTNVVSAQVGMRGGPVGHRIGSARKMGGKKLFAAVPLLMLSRQSSSLIVQVCDLDVVFFLTGWSAPEGRTLPCKKQLVNPRERREGVYTDSGILSSCCLFPEPAPPQTHSDRDSRKQIIRDLLVPIRCRRGCS